MALQFDSTVRTTWGTDLASDAGTSALLRIYTGAAPATCATAASGTKLAELTCNATQFGTASGGVLTVSSITSNTAVATGTAGYFRVYDSAGTTCKIQGTVATSGADLNITNTSINTGDNVSVSSWTITSPGA